YRYVKLAVLGSLAAALVLNTHSLLASLQRNELSERRFLQLNKCPACWGTSWCRKFLNGQLRLESWGRLRLFDFFNVKNVYFARYGEPREGSRRVVSQPFLIREMLQSPDHLGSSSLDLLKQFPVLKLGSPELDAVLQMWPYWGGIEGEDNLPQPAGHTLFNAPQDTVDLLGHEGTLLAHGQPSVHQHSKDHLSGAAFQQSFPSDEGWPFAKYLGACGRMVAVNYVGEELWSYFNAPWEKRVDLAWQLMEIAEQLTNNDFEFALYLLDVSFDNFAVGPRDGKVIIVDAENVLVADKRLIRQNKPENWDVWYESKFDDCDKEACLSFSKEILCARVTVDHNYYAICQNLLSRHATWRGTSGGLLHDPPAEIAKDGRLEALLDECANPKKRYGRFQASKELREYLAQLSNNVR
ncbi:DIA1 protein, partial [Sula dactylatra]|nr:DIA1 protein [Sula dactylatra]